MAARRRRVLLDLGGSSREARQAVREVREDLRRLSREDVRVRVELDERIVRQKIDRVQQRLQRLSQQNASPEVDVKTRKAYAELDRLNARLALLSHKNINIDVDVSRGALERTASSLGALDRGIQGFGRGFANIFHQVPVLGGLLESVLGGAFTLATNLGSALGGAVTSGLSRITSLAGPLGSVAGSVVSLGTSLAGLAAVGGALIIALNAILGAIIALGGALVALVASAAAAAAGLGALAIAFGAALIPVAIVAIGVFQRFQAILKARQAQQQQLAQATQAAKTAEQAHTAALEERRRAEEQLAQATVQGREAAAQAIRDETDAELGLRNAKNGVEDARLQLALAKRDLREFLKQAGATGPALNSLTKKLSNVDFDPSKAGQVLGGAVGGAGKVDPLDLRQKIQAVRDAQLGVANATNQVSHAQDTLAQARKKEADFTQRGLRAYGPYRQALEAVARANQRVAKAADQSSAAERKRDAALKGLSGTERGTLSRLNAIVDAFTRLSKAFTDPIFRAFNQVFDGLKGHAGEFEGALTKVGTAFADVVKAIGAFLTEPRTLSAFQTMATGAADLVRQLGARAFTSFLRIMREVATSALPAVRVAARDVANWLERIAGKPGRIHAVVRVLVNQFRTWAGLAGSLVGLVKDLFAAAAPAGRSLAESLRHIVDRWRAWIRANPEKVRAFFRNAVIRARGIVSALKDAATWLKDHLPEAAASAKQAFDNIWPAVKRIADAVKFVVENPIGGGGNASGGGREARSDLDKPFKQALSKSTPRQSRIDLAFSLLALQISTNMRKSLVKLLKSLGITYEQALKRGYDGPKFAAGGLVPGSGRGDVVPAMLEPGEFVVRRAIVRQLSLPVLHALNGGAVPALAAPAGPAPAPNVTIHNRFSAPGGRAADMRAAAAELERELWKATTR